MALAVAIFMRISIFMTLAFFVYSTITYGQSVGDRVLLIQPNISYSAIEYGIRTVVARYGNTLELSFNGTDTESDFFPGKITRLTSQVIALKDLNASNSCRWDEPGRVCSCDRINMGDINYKVVAVLNPDLVKKLGNALPDISNDPQSPGLLSRFQNSSYPDLAVIDVQTYKEATGKTPTHSSVDQNNIHFPALPNDSVEVVYKVVGNGPGQCFSPMFSRTPEVPAQVAELIQRSPLPNDRAATTH